MEKIRGRHNLGMRLDSKFPFWSKMVKFWPIFWGSSLSCRENGDFWPFLGRGILQWVQVFLRKSCCRNGKFWGNFRMCRPLIFSLFLYFFN